MTLTGYLSLAAFAVMFVLFAMTLPGWPAAVCAWGMALAAFNLGAQVEAATHPREAARRFREDRRA